MPWQGDKFLGQKEEGMTQVHLQYDLSEWVIQAMFIISVLHAIIYGFAFSWWETVTGRMILLWPVGVTFALLRSVLVLWGMPALVISSHGVQAETSLGSALSWVSLVGLAGVSLASLILTWQAFRVLQCRPEMQPTQLAERLLKLGNSRER
jgi:hypothetical protein